MSTPADALHEPWPDIERQETAARFGMWAFLASEALFFGGLLLLYAVARYSHPDHFAEAARQTSILIGTANTAALLTSSFTMVLAERNAEAGARRTAIWLLLATAALGFVFMGLKGYEYYDDIERGLLPGYGFRFDTAAAYLFYGLYWTATGLHAVHVTVGVAIILTVAFLVYRRRIAVPGGAVFMVLALYWHLVDIIWVVLYPLLYLVGRAG